MDSNELLSYLTQEINEFVQGSSNNWISMRGALSPSCAALKMFDEPLIAVASAQDPLFERLREPDAVGSDMRMPTDWLPNACSVVSYFLPMSERVRLSNYGGRPASPEWFHARIEGQFFIMKLGEHITRVMRAKGVDVICPACHPDMNATFFDDDPSAAYRSNWSERHVAYVCGLGTFSLTRGIITEKGAAGRLGSVIVSAPLPITERPYSDLYEYCIKCGACIKRCPVGAISLESGKDNYLCHGEMQESKKIFPGYVGCGKCQVDVPCEHARP